MFFIRRIVIQVQYKCMWSHLLSHYLKVRTVKMIYMILIVLVLMKGNNDFRVHLKLNSKIYMILKSRMV